MTGNPLTFLKLFRKCTQPEALEKLHDIGFGVAGGTLTDIHSDRAVALGLSMMRFIAWDCLTSALKYKDRSGIGAPPGVAFSHASRMAIASATISPWLADQNRVHASSDEFGARHSRREDHSELLPSGLPVIGN